MKALKVLLATGASGGHIFPALVTAKELRIRGHEVFFAGVFGKAAGILQADGFQSFEVGARGFSARSPLTVVSFLFAAIKSLFISLKFFYKVKPDIVVGFGGYGAFPTVMAAVLCGIPTMIQEQNVLPGKANCVLSFFVKKIAVGFEKARASFSAKKVLVTGCPCRWVIKDFDRQAIIKQFGLTEGIATILVLGGSQGSRRINSEFIKSVGALKTKMDFNVVHICGENDVGVCKLAYENIKLAHKVYSFTDQIDKAYVIADLVVSRAGAMTVTELAAFALPAILIPYPYAGGHQRENALVLAQTKASRLIDEKELTCDLLERSIIEMLESPMPKAQILKVYAGIYRPDSAQRLADEIERLKM